MKLETFKAAFEKICELLTELYEEGDDELLSELADFSPPDGNIQQFFIFPDSLQSKQDITLLLSVMIVLKTNVLEILDDSTLMSTYDELECGLGKATDLLCEVLETLESFPDNFDPENPVEHLEELENCVGIFEDIMTSQDDDEDDR